MLLFNQIKSDMATGRIGGGFQHLRPHPRFHAPAPGPVPETYRGKN